MSPYRQGEIIAPNPGVDTVGRKAVMISGSGFARAIAVGGLDNV